VNGNRKPLWLLLVALTLALAVTAAGCGGGEEAAPPAEPAPPPETAPPPPETGAPPPAEGAIKIGLVTDTGGVDDRGFNQFSIAGMEQAAAELGAETRVYVSNAAEDYKPNLISAAEDGNQLVIAVGFLLAPDTLEVAAAYPDITFAGVDHFYDPPLPNTLGMVYPTEEAGYLAGVLAAMMTKSGVLATTAGKKIPPVDNWIAGFQQGALDTKPDVELLNAYSDDFDDQAKCKEIALDQISQGADIIFQVAGKCGLGALDAAKDKGVWAIGVDADQSFAGPNILTSALKPLSESVAATVRAFADGTLQTGQNETFGIQDLPDAALLAPYSADVPQEVQDSVAEATAKLASGEIDPPAVLEDVAK
jgi:basic membrane protein A